MGGKKTIFNEDWINPLVNKDWTNIFQPVKGDPFSAFCKICPKIFSLSNMGKQALLSHEKSVCHKKKVEAKRQTKDISLVMKASCSSNETPMGTHNNNSNDGLEKEEPRVVPNSNNNNAVKQQSFFDPEQVLEAEILWALHNVESHESLNSVNKTIPVLQKMFKDSPTAQRVKLSSKKLSYYITFGLAPYFEEELYDELKNCKFYVTCFDESLNKISQRSQMDICIRYWSSAENVVKTRYLTSVFMNGAKATDVLECFKKGLGPLKLHRLLQVSMDGPNVNWKFLRLLQEDQDVNILDLGSCGLHVVHGAFQTGHKAAGWAVNEFLQGIYWLFKDSPARRAAYRAITDSDEFPIKFCRVRWVESVSAAYRALHLFDNIKKYVLNENTKLPNTTTSKNVKKALSDQLIKCKIAFYATVATPLEEFLKKFQSSSPLVPYLGKSLEMVLRSLFERLVKKTILEKNITSLMKVNLESSDILKPLPELDIGFRTKKCLTESKVSEREKLIFLKDCRQFIKAAIKKIIERSPLKYKIVQELRSLDPEYLVGEPALAKTKFHNLLESLCDKNVINLEQAENASVQFNRLLNSDIKLMEHYTQFKNNKQTLDIFYSELLHSDNDYKDLFDIVKMMLVLSHGNAVVESGFSINKNMLVENLHEKSLIARRHVYDIIYHKGGTCNVTIDKKMKQSCRNAHFKYQIALEERNKLDDETKKAKENRKRIATEIAVLQKKKSKITDTANFESNDIDRRLEELRRKL